LNKHNLNYTPKGCNSIHPCQRSTILFVNPANTVKTEGVKKINIKNFTNLTDDHKYYSILSSQDLYLEFREQAKNTTKGVIYFRVFACMCRKSTTHSKATNYTFKKEGKHVKYSILYYTILIIINYLIIIINYLIIRKFSIVGLEAVRGIS
jgi:hypothetical protein